MKVRAAAAVTIAEITDPYLFKAVILTDSQSEPDLEITPLHGHNYWCHPAKLIFQFWDDTWAPPSSNLEKQEDLDDIPSDMPS